MRTVTCTGKRAFVIARGLCDTRGRPGHVRLRPAPGALRRGCGTRASHDPDASVRLNASMVLRWLVDASNAEAWIASAQAAAAR